MKIIKTAAFEQQMLFNPDDFTALPQKPLYDENNLSDGSPFSGDVWNDLEYIGSPELKGQSVESVLKHYGVDFNIVKFHDDSKVISADIGGTQYVIDPEDGSHKEASEWIYGLNDLEAEGKVPMPDFNTEFWQDPPNVLYHGTPEENVAEILANGLERRCETRGIGNKSVGCAVFASTSVDMTQSYGSGTIEINVAKMKEAGYTPQVSMEEGYDEKIAYEMIAHMLGIDDFHYEMSDSSLYEDTIVFFGDIPPQFLSLHKPDPRGIRGLDWH